MTVIKPDNRKRARLLLAKLTQHGQEKANSLMGKPFAPIIELLTALGRTQEARLTELEDKVQALEGTGKRSAYVKGRCECGPDNRTGKAAQAEMNAYVPLREAEVKLNALLNPKETPSLNSQSPSPKKDNNAHPEAVVLSGSQKDVAQVKKEPQSDSQ